MVNVLEWNIYVDDRWWPMGFIYDSLDLLNMHGIHKEYLVASEIMSTFWEILLKWLTKK